MCGIDRRLANMGLIFTDKPKPRRPATGTQLARALVHVLLTYSALQRIGEQQPPQANNEAQM